MLFRLFLAISTLAIASITLANAIIPTADKEGSKDNPLLKRYEGSFIVSYEHKAFDEFTFPLSGLEPMKDKKDSHRHQYYEPKKKKVLEGAYTRLVYLVPAGRSPLEVLRNYQEEIKRNGGTILFECKAERCGGDPGRSSGGGSRISLAMYLFPKDRITDPVFSNGYCATTEQITDQRYLVAELPAHGAHVSVLTYTLKGGPFCKVFNGHTIAIVDIVEAKAREQKMVMVSAEEMANQISATGSVTLYGIYFDFNQTDVKPESDPALEQITKLLKNNPTLKLLVVGHTDNVGSFSFNMDLSQRRAAAVVNALADRFGISKDRLTPVGTSFASPVASNTTEDGRAKNRRVELVEHE